MTAYDPAKLSVLIGEPSAHMSGLIASMLRALDIRKYSEVTDPRQITLLLKQRKYDLVVIDGQWPDLDTVALVTKLRGADGPNRETPIIMMSSTPDIDFVRRARDAGVHEFLRKPFAANHLKSRLDTIYGAPRPFIAAEGYTGPDRRRRTDGFKGEDRRSPTDQA